MIIFLHKLWILLGQIILWYIVFGFAFFIYTLGVLLIIYLLDLGLNFIFNYGIFSLFDSWTYNLGLTDIEKILVVIPLILFFMRDQLSWMSKDHNKYDGATMYNPFTSWGNITYMKKHKAFYEKYYTDDYIKWKKKEEKRKNKNKKNK